eukprot:COSAG04_NODE_777_length_10358_cov_1284.125061_11_plen_117_part_00
MRLGNGNESDSSAPTIRLATLIRGARTAAGGEGAVITGVGASTSASAPVEIARRRPLPLAAALWSTTQGQRTHTPPWPLIHPLRARAGCRPLAFNNKGVSALKLILMLRFEFVAQA